VSSTAEPLPRARSRRTPDELRRWPSTREPASLRFKRINSYATELAAQLTAAPGLVKQVIAAQKFAAQLAGAQGLVNSVAAAQRQAEQMAPVRERMIEAQRQKLEQWTVMGERMMAA
jgi:Na+(H+)/acetate symporter ActP